MESVYFGGITIFEAMNYFQNYFDEYGKNKRIDNVCINHWYDNDGEGRILKEHWDIAVYYEDESI